jgi:hypothetical protein
MTSVVTIGHGLLEAPTRLRPLDVPAAAIEMGEPDPGIANGRMGGSLPVRFRNGTLLPEGRVFLSEKLVPALVHAIIMEKPAGARRRTR